MNLLPRERYTQFRHEYHLRFVTLALSFLSLSIILGITVELSRIFSLGSDYFLLQGEVSKESLKSTEEDKKTLANLQTLKGTLMVLDPVKVNTTTSVSISDVIERVIAEKPKGVVVTSLAFSKESTARQRLIFSGIAGDREALVAFSRRLSDSRLFSTVNLPISNLSEKDNIDFSITLTIGK